MEIDFLKPKDRNRLIDLLSAAGVDVSDWGDYKGGASKAASNPKYCYEWSFEDRTKPLIVLNLWYTHLQSSDFQISQNINMREVAEIVKKNSAQRRRAIKMDFSLQKAERLRCPVRVIICDGSVQKKDSERSKAEKRLLDTELWYVKSYSYESGACVLVRGYIDRPFIDQFSIGDLPEGNVSKKEIDSFSYERSPHIRTAVLNRAKGSCEWCGEKGFRTAAGSIYLESHHIQPLSEDGADNIDNVIALCPNHHREAHFGENSMQFRQLLLERLKVVNQS